MQGPTGAKDVHGTRILSYQSHNEEVVNVEPKGEVRFVGECCYVGFLHLNVTKSNSIHTVAANSPIKA
jgi:hypothetical protein